MRFLHSMIRVSNLEESLVFFTEVLGLKEVMRKESEAGKFTLVFLSADEDFEKASETKSPLIELTYNWPNEEQIEEYSGGRNFGHVAFAVDNIYEVCQRAMDQGVVINRPPRCGHMAFFKTPDGISIELIQKNGSLEPQEPWLSMENTGNW